MLAQGAHNQFGDLPWTARVETLLTQFMLARPEIRDFLQSRVMVPYKEAWMPQVDTMKTLQGWTDVSVTHFRDLAVYGEQLLLSARYGDWINVNDEDSAKNWARYWRPEIQGYIHAYRAAVGVDVTTGDNVDATIPGFTCRGGSLPTNECCRSGTNSMLDFTSAAYLEFEHASWNLPAWPRLTSGKPSALEELPGTAEVESELAALVGCERALLGTSTLHLFWDLFPLLSGRT
ncbi:hypothetical protein [Tunturiibacter gelidiferens]|uniref:hypothetical protein n=1 Tax=Tunturiibacter gelidiferens TaxID=3069689 RepID=UPI003D9B88A2